MTSVPFALQEMIENYVHWNEDIGEWQLVRTQANLSDTSTWGFLYISRFELAFVLYLRNVWPTPATT